jgi:uncharacterized protein (DUF2336 family)
MIVRRFLLWARSAGPGQRAQAVNALARAYLTAELSPDDRREAETALTAMLDDPAPLVRRAMADAFADAADAPRHLMVALANDQSETAAVVLSRSPVLTDADLVDCAALGDEVVQTAIALRRRVSIPVAAALAEIASPVALSALADNPGADIPNSGFRRMLERHGADAALRESLLNRADLPLDIRQAIAAAVANTLSAFVAECGWLSPERSERVTREAREKTTVVLSANAHDSDVQRLVAHLRRSAQLTPALMLRAILSCNLTFAGAALAELTGLPMRRIAKLMQDARSAGFAALYRRAGLPDSLKLAFMTALLASREVAPGEPHATGARLSRHMIERVLSACAELPLEETGKLTALLRRFEVEAAVEDAREMAGALADEAALALVLEYEPHALLDVYRPCRLRNAA